MAIQIQRKSGTQLAQGVHVRNHQFSTDVSAAEKCPVHKLMTSVTTEITTTVERAG